MVKRISFLLILSVLYFHSCFKEQPSQFDGVMSVQLYVKYKDQYLKSAPVTLETYDYHIPSLIDSTDSSGMVIFDNIPWAAYQPNIQSTVIVPSATEPGSYDTLTVIDTISVIEPGDTDIIIDTLYTIASGSEAGFKINEIYYTGPPNNVFYFFDQFIELYNSSNDTIYLDGMVICRMGHMLESVTSIFQFPGEALIGREYPVPPKTFVVVAQDAIDHTNIPGLPLPESVDLSHADWEFRNSIDYGDYDNPDVPNLDNIEIGNRVDFMINLATDVVLIADGSDPDYLDGIDIESVIDCVEYASSESHIKDIEKELDRGFGGVGQIKYSAQSLERIFIGFDTNNSTVDFEIISRPTPGYQHE